MKRELDGLITQMHSAGIPYAEAVKKARSQNLLVTMFAIALFCLILGACQLLWRALAGGAS